MLDQVRNSIVQVSIEKLVHFDRRGKTIAAMKKAFLIDLQGERRNFFRPFYPSSFVVLFFSLRVIG
jgi:hypothetical protein